MNSGHFSISLINAPADPGANCAGVSAGPAVLRAAGLLEELTALGYDIRQVDNAGGPARSFGNETSLQKLDGAVIWCRSVRDKACEALQGGSLPLVIGGDHSVSIGSIAAVAKHCEETRQSLAVLWFDAHADFNTFDTTPSGNIHGMPAAVVAGFGHPALLALGHKQPLLKTENLYQVGVRAIDSAENRLLAETDAQVFDMQLIGKTGMKQVMQRILADVEKKNAWLHVSFDVDCLDPMIAPGTGTKVFGGLSYREARLCTEMLYASGLMRSLDVVEFNPLLDVCNRTGIVTRELIAGLFGKRTGSVAHPDCAWLVRSCLPANPDQTEAWHEYTEGVN